MRSVFQGEALVRVAVEPGVHALPGHPQPVSDLVDPVSDLDRATAGPSPTA